MEQWSLLLAQTSGPIAAIAKENRDTAIELEH
jgi:hypothetical protein